MRSPTQIPVDPGTRDQLFERFYTGDKASGSGLGLAIAKELAERMDGRIEIASGNGETTFSFREVARGWVARRLDQFVPRGTQEQDGQHGRRVP